VASLSRKRRKLNREGTMSRLRERRDIISCDRGTRSKLEAQAQWKRGDIEAQREARCDIVAILRFPIMGGKQDRALADVEIPNVAGSRFEK
jgi:hypothetical protein